MESKIASDELYPIAVLIDELKHDDVSLRLGAIRRLSTIALALGPERTRSELIPHLEDSLDEEDEVLTVLAEELGNFVPYVGGLGYAQVLIPPLETLAGTEEPLVREKAVDSLNKIISEISPSQVEEYYIPLIQRLTWADWFTNKVSVSGIFPSTYQKVSDEGKITLLKLFEKLVYDEAPMVRRAAATNLAHLVPHITKEIVISDIVPLFLYLSQDDQDSVRLLTIDILVAIANLLGPEIAREQLLSQIKKLFVDKSWRVRYMVADRFGQISIAVAVGDETILNQEFVPAFVKLLKDGEAEVRAAIAKQIPDFCQIVDRNVVLDEILPSIEEIVNDQSQHVRAALASNISSLAPILGEALTIDSLLPIFLEMLKDEFPEVRLNIICKLEQVSNVIGINLLSQSLLPAITQLAQDKQWRVRLAIIEYIPLLASQLGVEFFDTQLRNLCMTWLWDSVFSIREAATENLKNLTKVFGVNWAQKTLIPRIVESGSNPNYLYRMTSCFAATTLAPVLSYEVITDEILPFLNSMVDDPIPNIRFNVARSYETIGNLLQEKAVEDETSSDDKDVTMETSTPAADQTTPTPETEAQKERLVKARKVIAENIVPHLNKLNEDSDVDVRFFANKSLQAIG
ncbi:armadillo-type protein [Lipomyces japonicus]|uniref:armadillo-type protein n=1 Tax=Lipomyces japonicus TaxID=56871 RepID=UPI0034CFDBF9